MMGHSLWWMLTVWQQALGGFYFNFTFILARTTCKILSKLFTLSVLISSSVKWEVKIVPTTQGCCEDYMSWCMEDGWNSAWPNNWVALSWQLPKSRKLKERFWALIMKMKPPRMTGKGSCTFVLFARYFYHQMLIATKTNRKDKKDYFLTLTCLLKKSVIKYHAASFLVNFIIFLLLPYGTLGKSLHFPEPHFLFC